MTTPLFKVGDRVRRVGHVGGTDVRYLQVGGEYTVRSYDGHTLQLDGIELAWVARHFELVEKPAPEPEEWTPSDGWVQVEVQRRVAGIPHRVEYNDRGEPVRWWVREDPAPPLPTVPHTVIRPTWKTETFHEDTGDLMLRADGYWRGDDGLHLAQTVADEISGFEVLALPPLSIGQATVQVENVRRETAEAIRDRINYWRAEGYSPRGRVEAALSEFGVEA